MRLILLILMLATFNVLAEELEVVDKHNFIRQSSGEVVKIKSALAKASDFSGWQATSVGLSAGSSIAYLAGADAKGIVGIGAAAGLIALIKNQEKVDVVILRLKMNDGSIVTTTQIKSFSFIPKDKIVLTEANGHAFVAINKANYTVDELSIIDNRKTHFSADSVTAKEFQKECVNIKEKKLKKKKGKFYNKGKAKCDLVPVVLTRNGLEKVT